MLYAFISRDAAGTLDQRLAARAWADADPYMSAGVYEEITVKPFKKVLP